MISSIPWASQALDSDEVKSDIGALLARNLRYFMSRPGALYRNANALGVAAGISPSTVRHLLDPRARPASTKPAGYPTLDKLALIASRLGCEVWELLHPDIEAMHGMQPSTENERRVISLLRSMPPAQAVDIESVIASFARVISNHRVEEGGQAFSHKKGANVK